MTAREFIEKKKRKERIAMLTAYDALFARMLEEAGIDAILVGDSVGNVFQGRSSTREVTLKDMCYHTEAVARGIKDVLLIADLPIGTYDTIDEALRSAKSLTEAGAQAVKLEGNPLGIVKGLCDHGFSVMGHLGLLPQTAVDFKVKGKDAQDAERIVQDAISVADAGAFSIVLECLPEKLSQRITSEVPVPTIGIGAGKYCDGQVLVIHDMLGITPGNKLKFVKRYADLSSAIHQAVSSYVQEVKDGSFPANEHTFH
ncbi:MAG TPA: 3-methyl-2-oxobutanoate hydroxymethyltransferase [Spirochaetia bacterium]|nr:3-methyl-2-oxobutanoate hydroxymethyltransferase [Spirochaetia bacterium]